MSVYMITYNNERTIEKALRSVAGWAAEVVVVDSESTDGAVETVRQYTDRLYQFVTTSQRDKYQYAQDQCVHPWVLFIDADEWLTPEIKGEIERASRRGNGLRRLHGGAEEFLSRQGHRPRRVVS